MEWGLLLTLGVLYPEAHPANPLVIARSESDEAIQNIL